MNEYELYHHGIKGMKWGIRKYQNEDGSLTAEGEKRYLRKDGTYKTRYERKYDAKIEKAKSQGKLFKAAKLEGQKDNMTVGGRILRGVGKSVQLTVANIAVNTAINAIGGESSHTEKVIRLSNSGFNWLKRANTLDTVIDSVGISKYHKYQDEKRMHKSSSKG